MDKENLECTLNKPIVFTEDQLKDIEKVLGKIEEGADLQKVFTDVA